MTKSKNIYKKYKDKHKIVNDIEYKWCSDCNGWFPMNEENFKVQPSQKDGYSHRCRKCQEKYNHEHYMKNHEYNKASARAYKKANKEKCNKIDREYREKNKEVRKVIEKTWRDKHRLHLREYLQDYLKSNPEKSRFYSKIRRHKNHIINDEEWESCKKYFNYRCAYCGLPIEEHYVYRKGKMVWMDFCKEHVIDDGKNDIRNCIPSCNTCNVNKNTKSFHTFYNQDNPNYTYERYYKIYQWMRYDHKKFIMPKRRYKGQHITARLKEIELNKQNKITK